MLACTDGLDLTSVINIYLHTYTHALACTDGLDLTSVILTHKHTHALACTDGLDLTSVILTRTHVHVPMHAPLYQLNVSMCEACHVVTTLSKYILPLSDLKE